MKSLSFYALATVALLHAACGPGPAPSGGDGHDQEPSSPTTPSQASGGFGGAGPTSQEAKELSALPGATLYRVFFDLSALADYPQSCFDFGSAGSEAPDLVLGSFYQLPNSYSAQEVYPGQLAVAEWAFVDYAGKPTLLVPPMSVGAFREMRYTSSYFSSCDVRPVPIRFEGGGLVLSDQSSFSGVSAIIDDEASCQFIRKSRHSLALKTSGVSSSAATFTGELSLGREALSCPSTIPNCKPLGPAVEGACALTLPLWATRVSAP